VCARQGKHERAAFLDAMLSPRLLYGMLDILRYALGPLQPRAVPAQFRFEPLLPDGSKDNIVDCRIAVGFPSGILTLLSLAGPVIWTANYRRKVRFVSHTIFESEGLTRDAFRQQRRSAVAEAMASLGKKRPSLEHLLDVSRAAERIARLRL
jgi:NAD-dependent oxidoreductase involved in siderophore biosynthesis